MNNPNNLSEYVPRVADNVLLKPLQHRRVALHAAIAPGRGVPAMCIPVAVDIRPGREVVRLDHISDARQVVDEAVLAPGRRRLGGRLGHDLGFTGELDVLQDVGVESGADAVAGGADVEADVVVEDGKALRQR